MRCSASGCRGCVLRLDDISRRSGGQTSSGLQRRVTARQIRHARGIATVEQASDDVVATAAVAAAAVMIVAVTAGGARLTGSRRCRGYSGQLQLDQHHVVTQSHCQIKRRLAGQEVIHL